MNDSSSSRATRTQPTRAGVGASIKRYEASEESDRQKASAAKARNKKEKSRNDTNPNPPKKLKTKDTAVSGEEPATSDDNKQAKLCKKQLSLFWDAGFTNFRYQDLKTVRVIHVAFPLIMKGLNLRSELVDFKKSLPCLAHSVAVFASNNPIATQSWLGVNPYFAFHIVRYDVNRRVLRVAVGNLGSLNLPFNLYEIQLNQESLKLVNEALAYSEEDPETEHRRIGSSQSIFQACGKKLCVVARWQTSTLRDQKARGGDEVKQSDWTPEKADSVLLFEVFIPLMIALRHGGSCQRCFFAETACSSLDSVFRGLTTASEHRLSVSYSYESGRTSFSTQPNHGDRKMFEQWIDKTITEQERAELEKPRESVVTMAKAGIKENPTEFGYPFIRHRNPKDKKAIQKPAHFPCQFPLEVGNQYFSDDLNHFPISLIPTEWQENNIEKVNLKCDIKIVTKTFIDTPPTKDSATDRDDTIAVKAVNELNAFLDDLQSEESENSEKSAQQKAIVSDDHSDVVDAEERRNPRKIPKNPVEHANSEDSFVRTPRDNINYESPIVQERAPFITEEGNMEHPVSPVSPSILRQLAGPSTRRRSRSSTPKKHDAMELRN